MRAGIRLSLRDGAGNEVTLPRTLAPREPTPGASLAIERSPFAPAQYLTGDALPQPSFLVLSGPVMALSADAHLQQLRDLQAALASATALVARTDNGAYRLDLLTPPGWLARTPSPGRANSSLVRLTLAPKQREWLADATGEAAGILL